LRADCLQWLEEPRGEWDLVFLDPPSFSNSARMEATLDVQRDHVALIQGAMLQLAPGGQLYFSTNRRGFRPDLAALAGLEVRDLTEQSIDPDFRGGSPPHRLYLLSHDGR
jgi:23S rRNA (guanine2445-N2)-methyltransferase / 23S rRNA (guanine2069-N7)-methyltransferase